MHQQLRGTSDSKSPGAPGYLINNHRLARRWEGVRQQAKQAESVSSQQESAPNGARRCAPLSGVFQQLSLGNVLTHAASNRPSFGDSPQGTLARLQDRRALEHPLRVSHLVRGPSVQDGAHDVKRPTTRR